MHLLVWEPHHHQGELIQAPKSILERDWGTVWSSGRFGTECLPKFLYKQNFLLVYVNFALCNLFGLPGGTAGH